MLTVYGAWTPDEELEYAGTTTQALYVRERQHRCDAWRDETCCPLYRHAATLPNRLDDWTFRGLQCVCGDVFTASCDVEPTSCAFAWLMLWLSVVAHAMHYCVTNESDDDDETNTMYS